MPKVFISYRRADSGFVADIVSIYMQQHFGKDNVFLDVGSMPFGVDFRTHLYEQIAAHDVVLVLIGPQWAQIMAERAQQSDDFVRIEIESALALNKLVIPVRVMNAEMPDFTDLPASIHDLRWRQEAVIRRQPDLESDCSRLADGIRAHFERQATFTHKPTSLEFMPVPFEWIDIPGNLGKKWKGEPYKIAKYPVTNAQFAEFIKAGGYTERRWWTYKGWVAREQGVEYLRGATGNPWTGPSLWTDMNFNGLQQPVVGISWFEAVAFCKWLSEVTGEAILLPTEDQWMYAAQGDDGREYPWGDKWDGTRCNNNEDRKGIGKTTPVRKYEIVGDSPFGVVDLVGNVWEWCLTDFRNNTNEINSNSEGRALRGGSWNLIISGLLRPSYRYGGSPDYRNYDTGFRCVRTS